MANTEGLPDDFVESLMSAGRIPSSTSTKKASAQLNRQRQRLQERMDMPLPEGGPSAKVIRASPQNATRIGEAEQEPSGTSQPSALSGAPILGNILERTPTRIGTKNLKARKPSRPSRFKQQQQQSSVNGFPSVHMPLGTFVQKKKKTVTMTEKPSNRSHAATPIVRSSSLSSTSKPKTKSKLTDQSGITTESMLDASRRDAQAMLEGMTAQEIQEQQQEIASALSPDLVAFLKKRGGANKNKKSKIPTKKTPAGTIISSTQENKSLDTKEEKQRIAALISKVKTHEELDAAYYQVMQEPHPLEQEESKLHEEGDGDENFALACDLLRSTNARQTLWAARVVQKGLAKSWLELQSSPIEETTNRKRLKEEWPIVLPVSLRCLLDQPIQTHSAGLLLHTYALQSLHLLLLLNAHNEHVVSVSASATRKPSNLTDADIYQACFLDDAVPNPRLDMAYASKPVQPLKTTPGNDSASTPAAYATQSSSTSAQADGEAFDKDPMWTLLSKMKIVPRLAQLLDRHWNDWPPEAWTAILGILALIAQRSPGAASAIAHHEKILPSLLKRILPCLQQQQQQEQKEPHSTAETTEWEVAFAAFQLFRTLARQSRVAAESLPLVDILPPLLAQTATNDLTFELQKSGLQLWRSVLRYGLGLEALEAMTTLAAQHLALSYHHPYSLSTDYVSALAQVLECARLAKIKVLEQVGTGNAPPTSGVEKIPRDALTTLSMASAYLAATQRQIQLDPTNPETFSQPTREENQQGAALRWNAARLRFLSNYWSLASGDSTISDSDQPVREEIKTEEWSTEQVMDCLEVLEQWSQPSGLVQTAWFQVEALALSSSESTPEATTSKRKCQASASAFLDSFVSLFLSLVSTPSCSCSDAMVQSRFGSVTKAFLARILGGLRRASKDPLVTEGNPTGRVSLSRIGWVNLCHFAVSKFLFHAISTGELQDSSDLHLVRTMIFNLLGRLQRGNEAAAAVLFSQDILFEARGNPLDNDAGSSRDNGISRAASSVSSLFLGELCGSDRARKQLDHSFKLQHGFGITQDGLGAFALDSLLSEADQPGSPSSSSSTSDLALPIGKLWMWQCLSGQIRMRDADVIQGTNEAVSVVTDVLRLLLELEEGDDLMEGDALGYTSGIPLGAKLYYLMNVCLHPETLLRDDRVLDLADAVLDRYWPRLARSAVLEFSRACLEHTDPTKPNDADNTMEEKDKKLLELLAPQLPNNLALSSGEIRSLEAFLDDLIEAYKDYGAQYDLFSKVLRLFWMPSFPSTIRCRAIRELRGVLHLLTLPGEMENDDKEETTMKALLVQSVSGGRFMDENATTFSGRDPSDVLDTVTAVAAPGSTPRTLHGFVLGYTVALMARNLSLAFAAGDGIGAMKQRLLQTDRSIAERVCRAASEWGGDGSAAALVDAVLSILPRNDSDSFAAGASPALMTTQELDGLLEPLQQRA